MSRVKETLAGALNLQRQEDTEQKGMWWRQSERTRQNFSLLAPRSALSREGWTFWHEYMMKMVIYIEPYFFLLENEAVLIYESDGKSTDLIKMPVKGGEEKLDRACWTKTEMGEERETFPHCTLPNSTHTLFYHVTLNNCSSSHLGQTPCHPLYSHLSDLVPNPCSPCTIPSCCLSETVSR